MAPSTPLPFPFPSLASVPRPADWKPSSGFFQRLPPDSSLAFVLIQHLDPHHESLIAELLAHCTPMPVMPAAAGLAMALNGVYVIPPNKSLTLEDHVLHLGKPVVHRGMRMPIDHFFRFLAAAQSERATGIILSGTGSDGTLRIQAIKAVGGLVLVQPPESAYSIENCHRSRC